MGVLPDWMIKECKPVDPLLDRQEQAGVISYGLGSYGYDARVGYKFKVFTPVHCGEVDPKNFDPKSFDEVDLTGGPRNYICIPPNSFVLAETVETFNIPRDVLGICLGKSTYARCGVIINVTPLEPEWRGKVTVEISNTTPLPARIYAGEGIMQVLFVQSAGSTLQALAEAHDWMKEHCYPSREQQDKLKELQRIIRREVMTGSCAVSYADKKGRYQDQTGLTLPFVNPGP